MTDESAAAAFEAVMLQGQQLLAGLKQLQEASDRELAASQAELQRMLRRSGQLQGELAELRKVQAGWTAERQALVGERDSARQSADGLTARIAAVEAQRTAAEQAREQIRKELQESKQAHATAEAAAQKSLRAAFQDLSRVQSELEKTKESLAPLDQVKSELAGLQAAQAQWATERQGLLKEADRLAKQRENAMAGQAKLKEETEQLQAQITELLKDLQAAGKEVKRLMATVADLEAEQERVNADLESLQSAQLQWAVDREGLLKERDTARTELRAKVSDLKARDASHRTEIRGLEDRLSAVDADLDSLQTAQLQWATDREELLKAREQLRQEREALKAQVKTERERAEGELSRASASLTEMKSRADAFAAKHQVEAKKREEEWQREKAGFDARLGEASAVGERFKQIYQRGHDLYSALNPVIGFSDILLDERGTPTTPAERQEYLQLINEAARRLAKAIAELMEIARQQAGIAEHRLEQLPPSEVPVLVKPPTVLVADSDPAVRERMQILERAGYELTFSADTEDALARAVQLRPIAILLEAGLPPKGGSDLAKRLRQNPKTKDIPVVITSKVGKDQVGFDVSQFEFLTKPIDRQQLLQMMVKFDLLADGSRKKTVPSRVLLIDDDPGNVRLVRAMLRPLNIELLVADGGKKGIDLALKEHPDMVILDLMMPEVDGFEVLSVLGKDPTASQIPILIYTAKTITPQDQDRLQGNIRSIIQKGDFARDRFLEILNEGQTGTG